MRGCTCLCTSCCRLLSCLPSKPAGLFGVEVRYKPVQLPGNRGWRVADEVADTPYAFTEAEAYISAFALNAVAAGHSLEEWSSGDCVQIYDGPTEGVAPEKEAG